MKLSTTSFPLRTGSHHPLRIHSFNDSPLTPVCPGRRRPCRSILHEATHDIVHCIFVRVFALLRLLQACRDKSLLKVVDDVVEVLETQTHTDEVGRNAPFDFLLVRELLMCGHPRVDDERFGIADVG